jgi:autotransporter translocation and assembly factor TamB
MKWLKLIIKSFIAIFLFLLPAWIVLFSFLQTEFGQNWTFKKVLRLIEQKTDTLIEVDHFSFSFPLTLKFENLVIHQNHDPLIQINRGEIKCPPLQLLDGRLIISLLELDGIEVFKLPSISKERAQSSGRIFPPLPFYAKIEVLKLSDIKLANAILEDFQLTEQLKNRAINIDGMISHHPLNNGLTAYLKATLQDDSLLLETNLANQQLFLTAHVMQPLIKHLNANLVDLNITAQGHLAHWIKVLRGNHAQEQKIIGDFSLLTDEKHSFNEYFKGSLFLKGNYQLSSLDNIKFNNLNLENANIKLT